MRRRRAVATSCWPPAIANCSGELWQLRYHAEIKSTSPADMQAYSQLTPKDTAGNLPPMDTPSDLAGFTKQADWALVNRTDDCFTTQYPSDPIDHFQVSRWRQEVASGDRSHILR